MLTKLASIIATCSLLAFSCSSAHADDFVGLISSSAWADISVVTSGWSITSYDYENTPTGFGDHDDYAAYFGDAFAGAMTHIDGEYTADSGTVTITYAGGSTNLVNTSYRIHATGLMEAGQIVPASNFGASTATCVSHSASANVSPYGNRFDEQHFPVLNNDPQPLLYLFGTVYKTTFTDDNYTFYAKVKMENW